MTRADKILLAVLIAVAVLSAPLGVALARSTGAAVLVGPEGSTTVDLGTNATYTVQGRTGEVVFEVRNGELRCVQSDCPDQVCVRSGRLRSGAPIVCAPNGVTATFAAPAEEGGLDAISR